MADNRDPFALSKEQQRRKLRVGVAIDGSGVSEKALQLGARLLHPDRRNSLYILHIADPSKGWLPESLTPDHLEHEYQLKCHEQKVMVLRKLLSRSAEASTSLSVQLDAVWYKKDKKEGQSTCEALVQLTEEIQIDVLVVGSFGRKGERM